MSALLLTRRASRDLEALAPRLREAVLSTLVEIEADPEGAGRQLVGRLRGIWSARVGSYRILYTIEKKRIIVRAIKHRGQAYRTSSRRRRGRGS